MKNFFLYLLFTLSSTVLFSQNQDTAVYKIYPPGFYHKEILKEIMGDNFTLKNYKAALEFKMAFTDKIYPTDISKYSSVYHNSPVSQGNSGTCWAYAATSFMESEVYRITKKKVKLSEIFLVYWDYYDRAEMFVDTKGETFLGQGSEANAILRIMKKYGLMPYDLYPGLPKDKKFNDHEKLFDNYQNYLLSVKAENKWNKKIVLDSVRAILNYYLGEPPKEIKTETIKFNPQSYMSEYLKLNPSKYFVFMSTKRYNFNEKHELEEDDNWWHCKDYYNITIDEFVYLIRKAITSGYSVCLCGDVSEPGYCQLTEVAVVPDFDIPSAYINQDARELRLYNKSTTDDHCIHVVGYYNDGISYWYLIKDSGSGAFDGKNKGYRFYREDYIKLKMMNFMIHVDVAKEILDKIIK